MIFVTRSKLSKFVDPEHFKLGNHTIDFVHNYVYLGVIIDDVMSLNLLINNLKKGISNKVFMLRKVRKFLTFDATVFMYKQTTLPVIDYPGYMITACNKGARDDLQTMQNDIIRICNRSRIWL